VGALHPLEQGDAKFASDMVVTGPRVAHGLIARPWLALVRGLLCGNFHQGFKRGPNFPAGEAIVAVAPLRDNRDEAASDQFRQMGAGRRRADAGLQG
jgi:hypothetical protein